ncbi:MAG: L(+)-tartrate dehydratase subunit beta [Clostridia bacterium]|nr:L(+)-tartrate dehydratase subunit beta [Clostridia bacterium]
MKKILTTPLRDDDIISLRVGDVVYLSGTLVTARDSGHKRRVMEGVIPSTDLKGGAVFHAGPITKKTGDKYEIVAIGPTTSMRMEKYESDFISLTGAKMIIGKGGMGANTTAACVRDKAVHCVFPGGCAVVGASEVEEVVSAEWLDLGMPEAFYTLKVKEFGPLIVSIDTLGNNLYDQNKKVFNQRKQQK